MEILQVMNFLNEVANKFPDAISLAAGRPNPSFYQRDKFESYSQKFIEYFAEQKQISTQEVETMLCEYGPAGGIINPLLKQYLAKDEGVEVRSEDIIVTNGFQEAVCLMCLQLLKDDNDCVLTIDPAYIGLSALVLSIGKKVESVDVFAGGSEVDLSLFKAEVARIRAQGLNPKAIYVNPDFNNPMAYHLSVEQRKQLISLCAELELLIIEDSPYARFNYDIEQLPSLKALDDSDVVYHIGSFAKTFCPGVRVGFLVVPNGQSDKVEALVSLKSLISVNTSAVSQGIVGGFLLDNDLSLSNYLEPIVCQYRLQRDALVKALDTHLKGIEGVRYKSPQGGFFAVVDLPFEFDEQAVFDCAQNNKVICMPVSFFCLEKGARANQIRLSFSYYQSKEIDLGVQRLADYIRRCL